MKNVMTWFVLAFFCFASSGCATIISGKSQDVTIRSTPTGANVLIDGVQSGVTPMVANLIRKQRHTIKISKAGYPEVTRATTKDFNWWYIGNLIFGGIIGLIVDPITGAMYSVDPEEIHVNFENPTADIEASEAVEDGGDEAA